MRILIYLSHPAQFHFFRHTVNILKGKGHLIYTLTKTKDVLSHLLDAEGWEYHNILPKVRGKSRFSIIWSLILRDLKILSFARRNKIELLMGSDSSLSHVGKLLNIPCVTTLEDDYEVIRNLARLTYPFTSHILVPDVCDVGKWKSKKIGYPAYMKLAYLHPRYFIPDRSKAGVDTNIPFFLLRLSGLSAHHDFGIEGINMDLLHKIIALIGTKGKIFISSEETLPVFFQKYQLAVPVSDIHHTLSFATLLVCDSQSMAMEAAMLGVPGIRISSFSGRISVLEELEKKYQLTYGFQPDQENEVLGKIAELLETPGLKNVFAERRKKMLSDKIDVTAFLVWFIENYPRSITILKEKTDYCTIF
ncbi:MAG TPA: hypothetical protein PLN06_07290 [Bacteroidales bacterium]|jgi:hypothetical protein|nr:hypothetical protein [Bacteroidales bacterium]HQJ21070.1 hypothetical protein [Bacteroidales bacterium]